MSQLNFLQNSAHLQTLPTPMHFAPPTQPHPLRPTPHRPLPPTASSWLRQVTITYCGLSDHQPFPLTRFCTPSDPPPSYAFCSTNPTPPSATNNPPFPSSNNIPVGKAHDHYIIIAGPMFTNPPLP